MKKNTLFKYLIVKLVVFTILAIVVYIFRYEHVGNLRPFIGAIMLLYGVDAIGFEMFSKHKEFIHETKTYFGLVELIIGIFLIASPLQFDHVCIVWATWAITRESYELKEIVSDLKTLPPRILSGVESIVVIVFSILLLLEPVEDRSVIHIILLTVELVLCPLVPLLDEILISRKEKKLAKQEEVKE